MAFNVIQGFNVAKPEPADVKEKVANQAARLAIAYPFKGLTTLQVDTGEYYEYIGDDSLQPPPNTIGDWIRRPVLYYTSGVPSNSIGVNGDYAVDEAGGGFYKKSAGVWGSIFSFSGANILTGTDVPASDIGVTGDLYIRDDGGVYKKTNSTTWTLQFNIRGNDGESDKYATTSATSINLSTAAAPLPLTVDAGLSYTVGQSVVVASRSNNSDNITADVVSYNSGTGALVLNNLTINGTATKTDWDVNLSGAPGVQGKAFYHTEGNITLTQAHITSIQANPDYTPQNLYSASVLNDIRSAGEVTATPGIEGYMNGNSISWDGTNWFNNGTWRGPQGNTGPQGPAGPQGNNGLNGVTPNIGVGTVSTGNAGTSASVTISGTLDDPLFNFTIPRGDKGDKGDPGVDAQSFIYRTIQTNASFNIDFSTGDGVTIGTQPVKKWYGLTYIGNIINGTLSRQDPSAYPNLNGADITISIGTGVVFRIIPSINAYLLHNGLNYSAYNSALEFKGDIISAIVLEHGYISVVGAINGVASYYKVKSIVFRNNTVNGITTKTKIEEALGGVNSPNTEIAGSTTWFTGYANTWSSLGNITISPASNINTKIFVKATCFLRTLGSAPVAHRLLLVGKGGTTTPGSQSINIANPLALTSKTDLLAVRHFNHDDSDYEPSSFTIPVISGVGGGTFLLSNNIEFEISGSFVMGADQSYVVQLYVCPVQNIQIRNNNAKFEWFRIERDG